MKFLFSIYLCLNLSVAFAQCKKNNTVCRNQLSSYISDGQYRSANLKINESKIFTSTFYGGRTYKVVVANEGDLGGVHFKILSSSSKVLFDNSQHDYPSTWLLKFKNTSTFLIEVSMKDKKKEGCALMLIGFELSEASIQTL